MILLVDDSLITVSGKICYCRLALMQLGAATITSVSSNGIFAQITGTCKQLLSLIWTLCSKARKIVWLLAITSQVTLRIAKFSKKLNWRNNHWSIKATFDEVTYQVKQQQQQHQQQQQQQRQQHQQSATSATAAATSASAATASTISSDSNISSSSSSNNQQHRGGHSKK